MPRGGLAAAAEEPVILRRARHAALEAVFALAAGTAMADGGGVSVETGETLFSQGTSLALTLRHERSSHLYRGTHRVRNHEHLAEKQTDLILATSFGISETLTLGLVAPWTWKEDRELTTSGFADAAPVWQDLEGTQLAPDVRLSLTLSVLF